jgi:hypothetical protein
MAFHLYEDTWETSTTTGTGAYTLAGAVGGWRAFSAQYANNDTCWYSAYDGTNFEHGIGTYNSGANTLSRTTVYRSTNSGAAVNWAAGTRNIVVAPLGVVLDSLLATGSTGYPKRTADNSWTYVADPLPIANGGTNYTGGAWTTYTATLTPNTGTITQGGSAAYLPIGKIVLFSIDVTVTATTGSPASFTIDLPVAVKRNVVVNGEEVASSGLVLHAQFTAGNTRSAVAIRDASGALRVPTVNDEYSFSGCYEAQ